ncbi:MAG TPA: RAD55 family ATPase [Candidatus Thermoplasmatota archaeon]|nr:RAD55 family ATPase [Candidatus Thermoplasmatota archaeon]
MPMGVKRLDILLGGGVPPGSAVLLYGPPFLGKEVLAHRVFLGNALKGTPGLMLLTNKAASDLRAEFAAGEPGYADAEAKGMCRFVDTYSRSIGAEEKNAATEYLDGALDLNGLSVAVNKAQRDFIAGSEHNVLVLDSVSTLVAYSNPQTAFRFLQTLIGRTRRVGSTGVYLMDHGMHNEADVQMFKHLMSGVIEVRENGGKTQMLVQGLGAPAGQGWVEYRFDDRSFEITGSFAAGRIR